jgi:hypothetical protein
MAAKDLGLVGVGTLIEKTELDDGLLDAFLVADELLQAGASTRSRGFAAQSDGDGS